MPGETAMSSTETPSLPYKGKAGKPVSQSSAEEKTSTDMTGSEPTGDLNYSAHRVNLTTPINYNVLLAGLTVAFVSIYDLLLKVMRRPQEHPIYTIWGIPLVIKAGDSIKVKEAHQMLLGARVLQRAEVLTPRVYCAFQHNGRGYIVMEKVKGVELVHRWKSLSAEEKQEVMRKLKGAVEALRQCTQAAVSAIDGGPIYHPNMSRRAGDYSAKGPFATVSDYHQYELDTRPSIKSRLATEERKQFLKDYINSPWTTSSAVLTHGDLSPYNIMIDRLGAVAIIDWDTCAFWPAYFERYWSTNYKGVWENIGFDFEDFLPLTESERAMTTRRPLYFHFARC